MDKINKKDKDKKKDGQDEKNGQNQQSQAMQDAMDMTIWQSAKTDPQGWYTGTPANPWEVPVQDADDL